jgi:FkbM family methyltransferase
MKRPLILLAKKIYLSTPSPLLRRLYYRTFCAAVRNRVVETAVDGIHYRLDLGEVIDVGIYLNRYEPHMTKAIEKHCQPGHIVLDIGANIGAHALRMARIVGESGKVYAFEPTEYAYRKLVHNVSLNSFRNIVPSQLALSDRNLSGQVIRFRSSWPTKGTPAERESRIDFVRLDDWFAKTQLEWVDLIKLDVDGNEHSVIMGAECLLTRVHPPLLMEVWGPNFSDEERNPFVLLKQWGYRFFRIDTAEEVAGVDGLRSLVSFEGKLLDQSFDIMARC